MNRIILFAIGLFSLTACKIKNNESQVVSNRDSLIESKEITITDKQTNEDTIVDLKKIGLFIIETNSISNINEKYIIQIMDSIRSKDTVTRMFYFNVVKIIRTESDEYIADVLSSYLEAYCMNFPNEFFNMPSSELKAFAYEIGYEIATEEEDPSNFVKEYVDGIIRKSQQKYQIKIEEFSGYLNDAIRSNKE